MNFGIRKIKEVYFSRKLGFSKRLVWIRGIIRFFIISETIMLIEVICDLMCLCFFFLIRVFFIRDRE